MIKICKIVLTVTLLLSQNLFSQAPDTLWTKTFGGNLTDIGNSVIQTNDGDFIIAGVTESFGAGGKDVYLVKTDSIGDTLWTKTFGGSNDDEAKSIRQTNDNGFIISGTTSSFGNGMSDILLLKINTEGNTEWFKTYGSNTIEWGKDAKQTYDGGYIVVGDSNWTDVFGASSWIIKTDQLGNILWTKSSGHCCWDAYFASSVQQVSDSGFIVCGTNVIQEYPFGISSRYFLSKYSTEGDLLWIKRYDRYGDDNAAVLKKTNDGNLIIGGTSGDMIGYQMDIWLIKVNINGNIIWQKVLADPIVSESLTNLANTFDGGFIITKHSSINNFQLIKISMDGVVSWEVTIGGAQDDRAYTVQQTADSGYIVAGGTKSFGFGDYDIWLLRFDNKPPAQLIVDSPNGGEVWTVEDTVDILWTALNINNIKIQISFDNGSNWTSIADSTPSSGTYTWIVSSNSSSNQCLVKILDYSDNSIFDISDSVFTIDIINEIENNSIITEFSLLQNYPNPFNPSTKIKFTIPSVETAHASSQQTTLIIYDVLGNEIATLVNEEKSAGSYEVEFNATGLPSGIYFYQLTAGTFADTKKMILLK